MKTDRIKQLDSLLALLDAPKEGDEILFTLEGSTIKYRGTIKQRKPTSSASYYQIVSKTQPAPQGKITTIEYKGRVFKTGGNWKPI